MECYFTRPKSWNEPVLQANNHKGELCKTEGCDRMGKEVSIHLFLNVFVGVVCIVLFSQYVPLLIIFNQIFQYHKSCKNGNKPNVSALDTVT